MAPKAPFDHVKGRPDLKDVAALIKSKKAKRIVFATGAGLSTAAGIPDFRSPETGLYHNLAEYDLPTPEAIFEIGYFIENPQPFFTLAKHIYPGNYKPTLAHYFIRLVESRGLLRRCMTQNIDTLERIAGVSTEKIVEAHGSFADAKCLNCKRPYSAEWMKPRVDRGEVIRCTAERCQNRQSALVKPSIVFFGEGLPDSFFTGFQDLKSCDLLIVIGTSLQVQPFASIVDRVPPNCPRVLINMEAVGEADELDFGGDSLFGRYRETGFDWDGRGSAGKRDVLFLGKADDGVRELARHLGWEKELDQLYRDGHAKLVKEWGSKADKPKPATETVKETAKDVSDAVKPTKTDDATDELAKAVSAVKLDEKL